GPCTFGVVLLQAADTNRRERRGLLDRQLAGAAELQQREEGRRLLETRHLPPLRLEVEARPPAQERAEALEKLRDRREAEGYVRERNVRRVLGEQAKHPRQRLGILRRERRLDLWRAGPRAAGG